MFSPIICCVIAANAAEVTGTTAAAARFEANRSWRHAVLTLTVTAGLVVLGIGSVVQPYLAGTATRSQTLTGLFFSAILAVYLWHALQQLRDDRPILIVAPEGLHMPAVIAAPIPWAKIRHVICRAGLISKGKLEIEVDLETYGAMRLGLRMFGDTVVRRPARQNTFVVLMVGTDRSALATYTEIRRYWTPRAAAA